MEPEEKKEIEGTVVVNTQQPTQQSEETQKHTIQTYADDLSKAMNTTDASVIQELLSEGKEREQIANEEKHNKSQRGWYKTGATILIIFSLASLAYGGYHYKKLTVPAKEAVSVGVFPSTEPVLYSNTDIRKTIEKISSDTTLQENKPTLIPLVSDEKTLTLLSNEEIFSFFESKPSEPFLAAFSLVRMGAMNVGGKNVPFVIASINDTEIAAKELLIAEPDLLKMFYRVLNIDISKHGQEIGKSFVGEYLYNIPIRSLRYDSAEKKDNLLFFYARATDQIVVFSTEPGVLKAIYDSIISQRN
jgi:hypothetical protein